MFILYHKLLILHITMVTLSESFILLALSILASTVGSVFQRTSGAVLPDFLSLIGFCSGQQFIAESLFKVTNSNLIIFFNFFLLYLSLSLCSFFMDLKARVLLKSMWIWIFDNCIDRYWGNFKRIFYFVRLCTKFKVSQVFFFIFLHFRNIFILALLYHRHSDVIKIIWCNAFSRLLQINKKFITPQTDSQEKQN